MTYIPKGNRISSIPIGTIIEVHTSATEEKIVNSTHWKLCDSTGDTFDLEYFDKTKTTGISRPNLIDEYFLMGGSGLNTGGSNDMLDHDHTISETTTGETSVNKNIFNTDQTGHSHTITESCLGATTFQKCLFCANQSSHYHNAGYKLQWTQGGSAKYTTQTTHAGFTSQYASSSTLGSGSWGITCGLDVCGRSGCSVICWTTDTVTSAGNHCHSVGMGSDLHTFASVSFVTSADHCHAVATSSITESTTGQNRPQYFKVKYYIKVK